MQRSIFFLLSILALTSGCSNKPIVNSDQFQPLILKTDQFTSESEKTLFEAETQYEKAINSNLTYYSPSSMAQATELLYLARDFEIRGLQNDSLISSKKVLALLNLAEKNKTNVERILKPLLAQKLILEEVKSPQVLPKEFNNQMLDIQELVADIESSDEVITIETIQPILNNLKQLEIDTLLTIHWQPAKETLDKAKEENANKNAPQSFNVAQKILKESEIVIRNNVSNRELVAEEGLKALRSAQHVLYIARDAERLVHLDKGRAENAILDMEDLLHKISIALKAGDFRHMALTDQVNAIAQSAETQGSRLIAPLQTRISFLEQLLESSTPEENEASSSQNVIDHDPEVEASNEVIISNEMSEN